MPRSNVVGEKERNLWFIRDPNLWPQWPMLPLKRWSEEKKRMEHTLIFESRQDCLDWNDPGQLIEIQGGYLFDSEKWKDLPQRKVTAQQLVDEGWIVD